VSISHQKSARYILRELELDRRATEEIEVAPPHRVHLEHIYPRSPQEGVLWPRHTQVINRLGNLTLLSRRLNQQIKNGPFVAKKTAYAASELLLTRVLSDLSDWNAEAIDTRQAELAERAVEIWRLTGEADSA
jgi:hypothetical protein